jgi:hypothetical protein
MHTNLIEKADLIIDARHIDGPLRMTVRITNCV